MLIGHLNSVVGMYAIQTIIITLLCATAPGEDLKNWKAIYICPNNTFAP